MNAAASKLFAEGYMKGFFGTVGLMLGGSPDFAVARTDDLSPDDWPDMVSRYSAALSASAKEGGAIVVLLPAKDVNAIASLLDGKEPDGSDAIREENKGTLKEVFESCLGGGAAFFKEQYEKVIELTGHQVTAFDIDSMESLSNLLGDDAILAEFTYDVPDSIHSKGALVFSTSFEKIIPQTKGAEEAAASAPDDLGPALAQEELDSILENIGKARAAGKSISPAPVPAAAPVPEDRSPTKPLPPNIDRVLDIALVATARLGRVEMPIAEILALGPGSIIEVGHLVDEPVELLVNDKLIARGDVVVVDEKFGLRITEIVSHQERIESLR